MILVVDDNPKIKESLGLALPEHALRAVSSGTAAADMLKKPHEAELVLLDLKLKDSDGIEVLKTIKSMHPWLPVIILTGYGSKENVLKALRNHADDFIEKPFDISELRAKVLMTLEACRLDRKKLEKYSSPVQRVLRLMQKNYDRFLSLENVSEVVCLSPKYISRLFKDEVGVSFVRFRNRLKTRCAKRMLLDASQRVHQVAQRMGYQNTASFMRMFKKTAGCTPTEYREKSAKGKKPAF